VDNNLPSGIPAGPELNSTDRKKIFFLVGAGVVIILLLALIFFIFARSRQKETVTQPKTNNSQSGNGTEDISPTGVLQTETVDSPGTIANNFYTWYVNHPSPINSGEYETRNDVTEDFKKVMGRFYKEGIDPGYDHVFCEDIVLPKNAVPAESIIDEGETEALVTFKAPEGNSLFSINLEKTGGRWLVSDVKCAVSD
jgi:hypothetical protein